MKIPIHRSRRSGINSESMTPMIDVVFLLLVFFVCASVGQIPDALLPAVLADGSTPSQTEVPVAEPEPLSVPDVRIRLTRDDGRLLIEMNGGAVNGAQELRQRLQRLAAADNSTRIILDVRDEVTVQQFVAVYDLCQSLGFQSISFAVRQ
ncbi:MAG: biopolymer transporter ExbD [Planctomycetaceae bacterium]|nr:biopolymer transporter ExbD [Planctomycetaceae bacterium]